MCLALSQDGAEATEVKKTECALVCDLRQISLCVSLSSSVKWGEKTVPTS